MTASSRVVPKIPSRIAGTTQVSHFVAAAYVMSARVITRMRVSGRQRFCLTQEASLLVEEQGHIDGLQNFLSNKASESRSGSRLWLKLS